MAYKGSSFKEFFEGLEARLRNTMAVEPVDHSALEATIQEIVDSAPVALLEHLKRRAPPMLKEHRTIAGEFERRCFLRWQAAFDLLEMMIVIADETGEDFAKSEAPSANASSDYQTIAIAYIFPRAILVCREIMCLLKGGFPDGALTRWRTLHELRVTAVFLKDADPYISRRYLSSFHFEAIHAAKQYNHHAEKGGLEPFSDTELAELENRRATHEAALGCEMGRGFDWAQPAINGRATFAALEEATGLDHWRPRYKWASQHTHGGHRPPGALLGLAEADRAINLVGASNSGFVDPMHMTALALSQISAAFLLQNPNVERIAICAALQRLTEDIRVAVLTAERETLEKHREQKAKG